MTGARTGSERERRERALRATCVRLDREIRIIEARVAAFAAAMVEAPDLHAAYARAASELTRLRVERRDARIRLEEIAIALAVRPVRRGNGGDDAG